MNWYLAKIVYRIICGDGDHKSQFDEQLRLVTADNKEDAFDKAQQIGKEEQETFINQKDQLVVWAFVNVCELYKLSELIDGAELYSRIEEREDTDEYIRIIHKKAERIRFSNELELLKLA